jgi:hypothetical protein
MSSSQRESTAPPQFGHPAYPRPLTPSSTPGHGSWHAANLNISSPGFLQGVAAAIPERVQPAMSNGFTSSNSRYQTGSFGFGLDKTSGSFWQRTTPSSPQPIFPNQSPSHRSSTFTEDSEQNNSSRNQFGSPDHEQHGRLTASYHLDGESRSPAPTRFAHQAVDGSIANNAPQTECRGAFGRSGGNVTEGDFEMANTLSHAEGTMMSAVSQGKFPQRIHGING